MAKAKFRFNEEEADRVVRFFERVLKHTEGQWAGHPFILEPWQRDEIIRPLFGWQRYDPQWGEWVRKYSKALILVPRGNGKALDLETPVPTPHGWARLGDLEVGDELFDESGRVERVIALGPILHERPCFRVELADGSSVVADGNHEWRTEPRWKKPGIYTTAEIAETLTAGAQRPGKRSHRHRIPVAAPLQLPDQDLVIAPYVLGVWLGDGNERNAYISYGEADAEILEHLAVCGVEVRPRIDKNRAHSAWIGALPKDAKCRRGHERGTGSHCLACERETDYARRHGLPTPPYQRFPLMTLLRAEGLLCNKHIPSNYLRASFSQRLALLQGLMDSDGTISKAGQCEFTTTNEILATQVAELIRTLGLKVTTRKGTATLNGVEIGPKWRLQFWAFDDVPVFRLRRKLARQKKRNGPSRIDNRYVVGVHPVPSRPVRCIQVSCPSGLFLAGDGMITTHNSEIAAGIELYMLTADGEYGAEVYGGAEDRDQAGIVFRVALEMVRMSPILRKRLKTLESRKRIVDTHTNSFYQVLPRDRLGTGSQGFKPHAFVIDEFHVQKTMDFHDAMKRGMGKRQQSLGVLISTETDDPNGAAAAEFDYAINVHEGKIDDPSYFTFILKAPKEAEKDPFNEKYWYEVNPALGKPRKRDGFLSIETLRQEAKEAKEKPKELNNFLRFRLNLRVKQSVRWMPMAKWDESAELVVPEKLKGETCYGALHVAASTDVSAWIMDFPQHNHTLICRFWAPEARREDLSRRTDRQSEVWARDGDLIFTPGDVTDYAAIRDQIGKDAETYGVREFAYHRFGSQQLATELDEEGLTVISVSLGQQALSPATKALHDLVYKKQYRHGGNPVLRWMMGNVSVKSDSDGNIKIDPKSSGDTVVGPVAAVMALDRAIRNESGDVAPTVIVGGR